jgi:hypothetical protein
MCDFSGCPVRKGDKHQIARHRAKKHPQAKVPNRCYKDQDEDPLAAAQLQALSERGISYDRIVKICQAKCIADLSDVRAQDSLSSPASAIECSLAPMDSSPVIRVKEESLSVPVSPTSILGSGLDIPRSLHGSGAGTPVIQANSSLFPTTRAAFSDPIVEFVNNILVPHVDQLNLTSPFPTRETREQHLASVIDRICVTARERLDKVERRRSSVSNATSNFSAYQTYTDLFDTQLQSNMATPALTNNTKSLTGSASYGSLKPFVYVPGFEPIHEPVKHLQQQEEEFCGDTALERRVNYANDCEERKMWEVVDFNEGE